MTFWRKDKTAAEVFSVGPDEFRSLCGLWPTGVSVVTTRDAQGQPYGVTMNSVTSVSLDPPLLLICVKNALDTLDAIRASGVFCINVLASDQEEISRRFAHRRADKFDGLDTRAGRLGAPVLKGVLAVMECRIEAIHPGGDHQIVVGELVHGMRCREDALPLIYFKGRYTAPEG